jgi:uncharacterized membrane protein
MVMVVTMLMVVMVAVMLVGALAGHHCTARRKTSTASRI